MSRLSVNEMSGDFTVVKKLTYEDIANQAGAATAIGSIPAYGGVDLCVVAETVALAGASDITLDVGTTSADPDEFIDALDVDAMSAPVANTGDQFVQAAGTTTISGGSLPVKLSNSAQTVYVKFGGTVANLTAGEVVVGYRTVDLGRFA